MDLLAVESAIAQSRKTSPRGETLKLGANSTFGPLKQVDAGELSIGYAEAGPRNGPAAILLHGWPYDIHTYVDVAPLLAAQGYRVIVPYLRGFGTTRFLSSSAARNAQQTTLAVDIVALMDALKIPNAILGGCDWGARTANVIAALWPERCNAMVSVSGYLIGSQEANKTPLPPKAELAWWYQYYFATERGRLGYEENRHDFARLIWQLASPKWDFDDATFDRTAASFENVDHVAIVIHNYRWRLSLAAGESRYDDLEKRLSAAPVITVPTITLEGDANGAPHPDATAYAGKFSGPYRHRVINGASDTIFPKKRQRRSRRPSWMWPDWLEDNRRCRRQGYRPTAAPIEGHSVPRSTRCNRSVYPEQEWLFPVEFLSWALTADLAD